MEPHAAVVFHQKKYRYLLNGELDGPQSPKGVLKNRKIFAPTGVRTLKRPAKSLSQWSGISQNRFYCRLFVIVVI